MGVHSEEPLYTPQCSQRLEKLSQRLVGFGENGGWAKCFSGEAEESGSPTKSSVSEQGTQRKRKGSFIILDSDGEETGQQSKRIKMDVSGSECLHEAQHSTDDVISARLGRDASEGTADGGLQPASDSPCDVLPEHIKVGKDVVCSVYIDIYHNFINLVSFIRDVYDGMAVFTRFNQLY